MPAHQVTHVRVAQLGRDLLREALADREHCLVEVEDHARRHRIEAMGLTADDDRSDDEDDRRGGDEDEDVQMPMRCASSSRWYVGSPNSSSDDLARLKYRCAGCSHVNPMPPWIWMFSAAAWK